MIFGDSIDLGWTQTADPEKKGFPYPITNPVNH